MAINEMPPAGDPQAVAVGLLKFCTGTLRMLREELYRTKAVNVRSLRSRLHQLAGKLQFCVDMLEGKLKPGDPEPEEDTNGDDR